MSLSIHHISSLVLLLPSRIRCRLLNHLLIHAHHPSRPQQEITYARFDPLIPPALNLNIISLGSRHTSRSQGFLDNTEEWGGIALHVGNDDDLGVFSGFDLYGEGTLFGAADGPGMLFLMLLMM